VESCDAWRAWRLQSLTKAFGWLDASRRAFSPASFGLAASYLALSGQQRLLVLAAARVLAMGVGGNKSVDQAVRSFADAQR
jgi:hypothetical protein